MKKVLPFLFFLFMQDILFCQSGTLQGKISGNGEPIARATISITGTQYGDVSGNEGYYKIPDLPVGKYQVKFSAIGFNTETVQATISPGKSTEVNVELKEKVIEVQEVKIIGDKNQKQNDPGTSVLNLKPEKAAVLPGAVQDVMRTLQSLPGVLAVNDFTSQLVIRGSGPDQNLIIMDDIEVFNPYRLYGVISMFNPEAISDISLITGGFPVKYGDRLSAVLDVTNREGPLNKNIKGNINASIVDANLVLEGKNPFGIRGSWLFNSRRTYYDLIIEPFVKKAGLVDENAAFPNFYDFQGKITFGPFSGHKFILNGIYSRDGVNIVSGDKRATPDSISVNDLSKNDLAGFNWQYSPSEKFLNKFIISWYRNGGDAGFNGEILDPSIERDKYTGALPDSLRSYLLGLGVSSSYSYRKYSVDDKILYYWGENQLEAGAGTDFMRTKLILDFNISPELRAILASAPNFRAVLNNIYDTREYFRSRFYVQNNFKISSRLYIQPGLRFDYYDMIDKMYASPRISISYAFDNLTTMRAVWGNYYQSPGYEKLRDANILFDLRPEFTTSLDAEKATHYVLSLERWLNEEWRAKIETYYKKFDNLIIQKQVPGNNYFTELIPGKDPKFADAWTRPIPVRGDSITQIPINNSYGEAYGFEIMIEKKNITGDNILSGWISYALAYANRYEDGRIIPFRFDQRNTINVVLDYKANSWLNIGLRFQYGSGFPFTKAIGIKPRIIMMDENLDGIPETPEIAVRRSSDPNSKPAVIYNIDFGAKQNFYNARKPVYHRLDLRFTAAAYFWSHDWNFYLDIINVYNHKNIINYDYFVTDDLQLKSKATGMFPILPTLGFSVRF